MKPSIVIIGGREVGKTSAIQMTWADEIVDYYKTEQGVNIYEVNEMIPGRETVDYEIVEIPHIRYTYDNPDSPNEVHTQYLSNADVIVILCPIND